MKRRTISQHLNKTLLIGTAIIVALLCGLLFAFQSYQQHRNSEYVYDIANGLATNIENALTSLEEACRTYCYSGAMERFLRAQSLPSRYASAPALSELSQWLSSTNSDISCITLIAEDGRKSNFKNSEPDGLSTSGIGTLFDPASREKLTFLYTEPHTDTVWLVLSYPVYSLTRDASYFRLIGRANFICATSFLKQIATSTSIGQLQITLTDALGWSITTSSIPPAQDAQEVVIGLNQHGFTLTARMLPENQDLLYRLVPVFLLGVVVVMALLLFCIRWQLDRDLLKPALHLTRQLRADGSYLNQPLSRPPKSCYELAYITDALNDLLARNQVASENLLRAQSQLYEAELSKRQAEISALQSQINPHFLYNTLQCIRGLSFEGRTKEIAEVASDIAGIFRYSIKSPAEVTLADEIVVIRKYLHIFDIRWSSRIHWEIAIPPELQSIRLPKMLLQPLVENAIRHGLEGMKSGARLRIYTERAGEALSLCVEDNGVGIAPERLSELREQLACPPEEKADTEHIGLINLSRRVQYAYGAGHGVEIISSPAGTLVRVRVAIVMPADARAADARQASADG